MRVKAYAKLNLCLEVLGRRPDGFHDLRTVFQSISLADELDVEFTPGRKTDVALESYVDIPDNLVVRAARAVLEANNAKGFARIELTKRIPMGGGLGGGSTDAAAVLLTLPALTKRPLAWSKLVEIATNLGSDVPFFLLGGTAVGLGRGTELYPIKGPSAKHVLLVTSGAHVSTPEAYKALNRPMLSEMQASETNFTQQLAIALDQGRDWAPFCRNDFESAVFASYPEIASIKRKLQRLGATPVMMTGSGSAVFGVFADKEKMLDAARKFGGAFVLPVSFIDRKRYFAGLRDTAYFGRG
jgi:4-diphosphocytidyl-2-C-methyl-D-erythritol kinase